jgi:glyceraldehyde-3-phosphate dehydrogenase/erythrose-4-phosphate dehydrogenase
MVIRRRDRSLAKIFGWYDSEGGYTCRLADLAAIVGAQL